MKKKNRNQGEIDRLEKKLLGTKNWIMKGEVVSKNRPVNSLIE
jgi:U3 small nucleolar ribonucleoprotein component